MNDGKIKERWWEKVVLMEMMVGMVGISTLLQSIIDQTGQHQLIHAHPPPPPNPNPPHLKWQISRNTNIIILHQWPLGLTTFWLL